VAGPFRQEYQRGITTPRGDQIGGERRACAPNINTAAGSRDWIDDDGDTIGHGAHKDDVATKNTKITNVFSLEVFVIFVANPSS
jgi:hypothetical protein